jgi:5-hydroxyisourate hydrolase-like protein (transthyretin family)
VRVKVAIVDSESRPVPGAHVTPPWQGTGGVYRPDLTVTAGADGIAWIEGVMRRTPPEILVEAGGWRSTYFQPQPREGEDTVECRVVLERLEARIRRRAIVGTVTDPMSRAIAGATIEWKDGEGTSFGDGAVYGQFRATSGADGEYRLEFDDDYDTCALGVAAPGWAPQVADRVQPGEPDAPARKDFTLERGHWLAGRALDEQGGPLAGVQVRAMPRLDLLGVAVAYPAVLREAVTDAEGRFRLEDLPGPKAALELAARDRRPRLEALVDVDQEVDIAVPGYGTIRGVVVDEATGDPVPAFTVKISGVSLNANRAALGESFTSPEGRFILKDLDSGAAHTLYVEADGYMTAVQEGVVPASSTALRIALSRGKPLEGQVIDAPSGQPIAGALLLAASADRLRSIQAADAAFLARLPVAAEVQTPIERRDRFVRPARGQAAGAPGVRSWPRQALHSGRCARPVRATRRAPAHRARARRQAGGTCYDRGAPARRVEVRLERAGGEWDTANEMDRAYARVTTDSEGRFAWDDLGIGTYSLKTDRAVAGPGPSFKVSVCRRIEVATLEDREVDLGKERGTSTIRGSIGGMEDKESLGITVTLRPLDDLDSDELEFSTYREWAWKYVCPDLKAGKYSVSVSFWQAGATRAVDLAPIEVGAAVEPTIEVPATAEAR